MSRTSRRCINRRCINLLNLAFPRPFYRTSSGARLWWELEEPKGPKGGGEGSNEMEMERDNPFKKGKGGNLLKAKETKKFVASRKVLKTWSHLSPIGTRARGKPSRQESFESSTPTW
jgi:hypothetical protein